MMNDPLATTLSKIMNYEKIGRKDCLVTPIGSTTKKVLDLLKAERYLGEAEEVSKARGGVLKINLIGSINRCGVIKPRYAVEKKGYEKFEKRYLPASHVGILIVSTTRGIMTHHEAKEKNIGGRLVAYCY